MPQAEPPSNASVRVVTDTVELRWFAAGPIPLDVRRWFGDGAVEERCDRYRLNGSTDVGLKLRSGELLELKVRQAVEVADCLTPGLVGRLERWRRWSPADGLVRLRPDDQWVDVTKTITKRRFIDLGAETAVDPVGSPTQFCDIELAAVDIEGVRWWSLALAACGLAEASQTLIRSAWDAIAAEPIPEELSESLGKSLGYPAWLAGCVARVSPAPRIAATG